MAAWMPIYWGDYFKDTLNFSTFQHGCYMLLIGAYWSNSGALPEEPAELARICRTSCDKLARYGKPVLAKFTWYEGLLYHPRVELELLRSSSRQDSARANGRAGGLAKSYLSTPTPTKEQESKILIARSQVGKKNGNGEGHTTIKDPTERLNRFQKWLAGKIGTDGWVIVASAADPGGPDYLRSLILCQQTAKSHGKGWPKQWPAPPNNQ